MPDRTRMKRSEHTMEPLNGYRYDYFISHTSEDRPTVVLPIARELGKLGIRYFLDVEQIPVGGSLVQNLTNGLRHSAYFIAIISPSYIRKEWTVAELNAAFIRHVNNRKDFILPILVGSEQQRSDILEELQLMGDLRHLVWRNNAGEIAAKLAERLK